MPILLTTLTTRVFLTEKTMAMASTTCSAISSAQFFSPTAATSIPNLHSFQITITQLFSTSLSKSKSQIRPITKLSVSSSKPVTSTSPTPFPSKPTQETIFFDGGAHYGDLIANLLLGFTLLWLPLTLAAVLRAFYLRYRFTNLRVTVISGLTGQDRSDFEYKVIKDVQVVPRFIGEWGDVIITLKDGTKVDLRSVPKFREIAKYCLSMADQSDVLKEAGPKGF